ncbi:MAG: glycosyltransferase family 2 protein [Bacteroidales bacterium]|nr:glycosyltransferase family 2 protein [Bacteroidales bacterium]MDD4673582.1 glycosyltransferase family 2 protein [Bacteroidales bacterium]MDY0347810.1 glycosyltransferase family 2 protein [Tenuifilaceae bacterium]
MISSHKNKIAVVSMMRNDSFFVTKWLSYYSQQFGANNLFLILDGHDQPYPVGYEKINVIRLPHISLSRAKGDRNRARLISCFAKSLFHRYEVVIAHDIDEILVVDPNLNMSLGQYLQIPVRCSSKSALGLDVGQHLELESEIDTNTPFLAQRRFAHVSARYTKPVVAHKPLRWGSGFHRVKGKNFRIDKNLFLFHFGMVDFKRSKDKIGDTSLQKAGWQGHLDRRLQLFEFITSAKPINGDDFFAKARTRQSIFRPIYAINKPGKLKENPIVKIPERFMHIV